MASESPLNHRVDIRAVASTLLQLSPIVLVVTYILEYSYVFQFLSQFNVTPEEVGISEIKLLTRAATLTVTVISLLGLSFAIAAGIVAVQESITASRRIQGILRNLRRTKNFQAPKRGGAVQSIRDASQQAESIRDVSAASFAFIFAAIALSMKPLGIQLSTFAMVTLFAAASILTATLFFRWRSKRIRYLTLACGMAIGISLLGIAVITGGLNTAAVTTSTGSVPTFIDLLGVDISQVHPEWLNSKISPSRYTQDQDLLELGSDTETTFLYDCRTDTTYRIPLNNVVLTYPLYPNETTSATLRRLHCSSSGHH
jgi:hypothetical protein